jgi:tRNA dimethylallyltransferase
MFCLIGPTASGKTGLAMELAARHPRIEIISMDSALVYRGMDIGTAKPTHEERQQVPHHLIDLIDPTESYSAARFVHDATEAARRISERGGIPLVVGGTMLYYKAYCEGLDDLPSAPLEIRQTIGAEAQALGWPAMHERLARIDAITAARLKPSDAQRISRALEIFAFTGKTMSSLIAESAPRQTTGNGARPSLQTVALLPNDRTLLHARIAQRFQSMVKQGLLDEVRGLMQRVDLHPELPSMRCVGYRQAWAHLEGRTSADEFMAASIAATRQLAKRQITWLRSFQGLSFIDPLAEQPDVSRLFPDLN